MSDALIYHEFRTALLQCRKRVLLEEINEAEADAAFDTTCETLKQTHCQKQVQQIYQQFEADLILMDKLQWLDQNMLGGKMIALIIMYFTNNDTINRISRTWRALISLDEELAEYMLEQEDV